MNTLKLFPLLFLLLWVSCGNPPAESDNERPVESPLLTESKKPDSAKGIVLAESGLTLRAEHATSGENIGKLAYQEEVEVLSFDGPEATIEQMTSPWLRIRTEAGKEGWVFGGFIGVPERAPHCYCKAEKAYLSFMIDGPEGAMRSIRRDLEYSGEAKLPCYVDGYTGGMDYTTSEYAISPSGSWLAFDSGTDIWGGITFLNLSTGKIAGSYTHDRSPLKWEGESLSFISSTGKSLEPLSEEEHPFWVETEKMIFSDGKLIKTGEMGRAETH